MAYAYDPGIGGAVGHLENDRNVCAGLSAEGLSTKLSHYFNTRRHLAAVVELSLDIWTMFCMHNFIIMYYALRLECGSHSLSGMTGHTHIVIYIYRCRGWWLSARLAGDYKWMSVKCANRQRSVGELSSIQSGSECWIVGRAPRPRAKQRQLQCGCIPLQPLFHFHSVFDFRLGLGSRPKTIVLGICICLLPNLASIQIYTEKNTSSFH